MGPATAGDVRAPGPTMASLLDNTPGSLDGEIIRDGEPGASQDQSLGERVTGADAESRSPDEARSLGAQSTAGDIGSSVSDLDDLGIGLVLEKIRVGD